MPDRSASPGSEASQDSGDEHQSQSQDHHDDHSKTPATKDKECPYCHQAFTSSSLGRHLDQFIFKKKPDGIHHVDEIRKLRGGITRRTARSGKKDHNDNSSRTSPAAQSQPVFPSHANPHDELNAVPPGGIVGRLNSLNWQSTGVITDPTVLNTHITTHPHLPKTPTPRSASPSTNLKKRNFSTYANETYPSSNSITTTLSDTARALELALREVLDSLRAATKHASTPASPFSFDVRSQTFPSLILHLLPTPPTLDQSSPFSTLNTTPISAPGPDQLQPLRNAITNKIDTWKWQALRLAQRTTTNIADEADFLSRQADSYTSAAHNHVNTAFENWMAHPPDIRDLLWHVDLLRALQGQRERVDALEEEMEVLRQEAAVLGQQVEYLSKCQWPREMALWPPERVGLSRNLVEEVRLMNLQKPVPGSVSKKDEGVAAAVGGGGAGGGQRSRGQDPDEEYVDPSVQVDNVNLYQTKDKWDFDRLVGKWRNHIKEDRQRRMPYIQSTGGPNASGNQNPNSNANTNMNTNSAGTAGASGMHWLGERGRWETATPTEIQVNGVSVGGSGSGTPLMAEEGRRSRTGGGMDMSTPYGVGTTTATYPPLGPRKNISIISDFGGD